MQSETNLAARIAPQPKPERPTPAQFDPLVLDLLDLLDEGCILFDAEDRFVVCNRTYRQFYPKIADMLRAGVPFEAMARVSAERRQFADSAESVEAFVRRRLMLHRGQRSVHEQELCDGRWLRVSEHRMSNGWILGTRVEITALKQREQALERARTHFSAAIEALQEGFALFDTDDRLVLWNECYREFFPLIQDIIREGTPFETLIRIAAERGQNIEALYERERWIRDRLEAHRRAGGAFEHHFTDGRHVRVRETKTKEGYTLSTYVDVTELKNREEGLIAASLHAEEASRAKSEFLANMSHELRTPLNAILGFSDAMRQELFGPLENARYRDYITDIHESGRHLLDLITDLLDISKIEAGRMDLDEAPVDLMVAIDRCVRMVHERAQAGRLGIIIEVAPGLPKVQADERALKRVVLNLLSNAIKFTPAGGVITIHCGLADGGDLEIGVADTGVGMSDADIPKALAPFIQLDGPNKSAGTGLGLPIANALMELHGGSLAIESTPGTGTTVTARLPRTRIAAAV